MTPGARAPNEHLPEGLKNLEQRKAPPLTCKRCGSTDMWRIGEQKGIIAAIMRYYKRKPFQCRNCKWLCYRPARRRRDNSSVIFGKRSGNL